ncbi:MAG: bifunctional (p)ppGpp synthetase/guanosine-3',5'-bis(diphosphate) 3'-pyrophosphohydrolase [Gallionellaceae bacterium]|nr:bifunctional (p)ppGpp synthetase/guanosine-3',5'-bis(diphosphate) 3'-pyrophosphohydrolase [Gallionellaceae bacterium]
MVSHSLTASPDDSQSWLADLAGRYPPDQIALLGRAADWLADHAGGLASDSGAPLVQHGLGTAALLAGMQFDADTVAAALVCALPDPALTRDTLAPVLGERAYSLAAGTARLRQMDHLLTEVQREIGDQSEALRQMLLAMTDDIRVVLIKLAERTQALRELAAGDPARRRKVAQDARELYAPLANRLGVWQLKWELEDMACRYLEPDTYKHIARLLDERRLDREWYIEQVLKTLADELERAGIAGASITGRPKHIASILAKMRKKHLDFEEVYDVRAVRVLVNDLKDCYHALGLVHSLWQPIPGQFDDYISRPKGNGYQSLHTAVVGPDNKALEVQIRTFAMHQEAELGVAAHWRYKEGGRGHQQTDKIAWLRQLLAWKQELSDSSELAQHFKNELFQDEIFVLTPQGKVVALAQGATPIDFAYAVHTELGHRCRGAKVDGVLVPLDTPLKTAQRVEILTVKQGGPSRDWLNPHLGYLQTHRARNKVRQWFRQQGLDTHIQEGRAQVERELHRLNLNNVNLDKLAARLRFARPDELFAALGRGDLGPSQLERALNDEFVPPPEKPVITTRPSKPGPSGVLIEGEDNLLTHMAGCCKPVPPDAIVGYTTLGRGVTVHRADCPVIQTLADNKRDRLLRAEWGAAAGQTFEVDVEILASDRANLLKDVAEALTQDRLNVVKVNTESKDGLARMEFTVIVRDVTQLSRFLARATHIRGVTQVRRK